MTLAQKARLSLVLVVALLGVGAVAPAAAEAVPCYSNTWKTNAASEVAIKIKDVNTGERYVGRGGSYTGHISGVYVAAGYNLEIVNTGQILHNNQWYALQPCNSWTKYGEEYRA